VIDTTGSFSPLRLRDVLAFRLEARVQRDRYQQSGFVYENKSSRNEENRTELIDQATSMLDRVKVMRVFDFAGVVEAVAEVKETRERSSQREYMPKDPKTRTRDEVHDSEEEIDDDDTPSVNTLPKTRKAANGTIGMIIVDTITNVVSSVMSRSQVHGQALLASFMRSLHHLITHYHICTILTNAVVGVNPTKNPEYQRRAEEHVSIFSSTLGKPALGKSYTYLIDTSILISAVPKTNEDAVIASRSNLEAPFRKALVIEVVKDRFGAREGRWAPFEIVTGVKLVPCPG